MRGLKLDGFKKVQDDDHSAVFQHGEGHKITVAKSALSDQMREQLKSLPLHAAGGADIDPEEIVSNAMDPKQIKMPSFDEKVEARAQELMNPGFSFNPIGAASGIPPKELAERQALESLALENSNKNFDAKDAQQAALQKFQETNRLRQEAGGPPLPMPPELQQSQSQQMPQQGAPTGQPAVAPQVGQFGQMPGDAAYSKGLSEGHQAIAKQQEADLARGAQEKAAIDEGVKQQNLINEAYQQNLQKAQQEREHFMRDYKEGHIDPRHYLDSMGGGKRVASAIGLILGGMGGGLTGQPNPALQFLQSQIDRDINAQVHDLDRKKGLLAANTQTFNDLHSGMAATRANLNDILSMKLKQAAANTSDPQAKARALAASSQLDMQSADHLNNVAMRQAAFGAMGSGQVDPARLVSSLVPQHHQAKVFAEIEAAQNTRHMAADIMKSFEEAAKENTVMRTGAGMLRVPGSVGALHQAMQPTFKDLEGTVRQAAMDNTFKNITPMPGDSEHKIKQKREALMGYLQSKAAAPTAKGFGIDLDKYQSTSSSPEMQLNAQQKQWLQWSRQNPNRPEAQAFMKKLGIQ